MFLNITKTRSGQYQFRNGNRRMSIDEVARRCPIEWIRTFDDEAASYINNHGKLRSATHANLNLVN